MPIKMLFAAAAVLLATTASAQTTTTTVNKSVTEPAPAVETSKHTTTVTTKTMAPDGVYLKHGVWMKGSRHATTAEISAHKHWVKTQTTKTTVKTETPS